MTTSTSPTNANQLDQANPNVVADMLRAMKFGTFVRSMPTSLVGSPVAAVTANPYVPALSGSITLPDDAKAATILRAYARAGTATLGPLTVDNPDAFVATSPITLHTVVGPTGDLLFLGADLWTEVDVLYLPAQYTMYEVTLPVVANLLLLPTTFGLVLNVVEAEALVGTATGKKIVDGPGTAPAALHAALDLGKLNVAFNAADAVTSARVKFMAAPSLNLNAFLEATSIFL